MEIYQVEMYWGDWCDSTSTIYIGDNLEEATKKCLEFHINTNYEIHGDIIVWQNGKEIKRNKIR